MLRFTRESPTGSSLLVGRKRQAVYCIDLVWRLRPRVASANQERRRGRFRIYVPSKVLAT